MVNMMQYQRIMAQLQPYNAQLVAVTKTRPLSDLQALYDIGQRVFGENRAPELADKRNQMPQDCQWHFIGHLQSNKLKYLSASVQLIHAIDHPNLLAVVNKAAQQQGRVIDCFLQVYIAQETTKQGFTDQDLYRFLEQGNPQQYAHLRITGLMGMASFTDNRHQIRLEFRHLRQVFEQVKRDYLGSTAGIFKELSMGMSGDYMIALEEGATMVRIGSLLFDK